MAEAAAGVELKFKVSCGMAQAFGTGVRHLHGKPYGGQAKLPFRSRAASQTKKFRIAAPGLPGPASRIDNRQYGSESDVPQAYRNRATRPPAVRLPVPAIRTKVNQSRLI